METISVIQAQSRIRKMHRSRFSGKEHSLINTINITLELIIRNTLKFNKLTSIGEICDNMIAINVNLNPDFNNNDIDVATIENICDNFCSNNGLLTKLQKKDESYYKLNNHLIV